MSAKTRAIPAIFFPLAFLLFLQLTACSGNEKNNVAEQPVEEVESNNDVTAPVERIPDTPDNLNAVSATTTRINLAWRDNADNEQGFIVERKSGTSVFKKIGSVAANVKAYADISVAAGASYAYRVAAYNKMGRSVYSNVAALGCFDMGDSSGVNSDALPVHQVCLNSYVMDRFEVTNSQYRACVNAGECTAPAETSSSTRSAYYDDVNFDTYPVVHVNRSQASYYCQWAGKRLPTEAEWEVAARGGIEAKLYPLGDSITCDDANLVYNGTLCERDTVAVGSYLDNGYGIHDMAGNVLEWVSDWYDSTYYASGPQDDPQGPATGTQGIARGGSWSFSVDLNQSGYRFPLPPGTTGDYLGFRCAK